MAVKKHDEHVIEEDAVVVKAKDFWQKNNRPLMIGAIALILLAGGYIGYKKFIKEPKQEKAANEMFKAEEYFRMDSLQLALNGDMLNPGFIKIVSKYDGTDAGNQARFYAGTCYLRMDDYANAVKYLKDFSTGAKQIQARAYKLLGDAYAGQEKFKDALANYKKAATHFKEDDQNAAEYYSFAAQMAEKTGDTKEAISLYKELKNNYPSTQQGFEADKYLAKLGVYETE